MMSETETQAGLDRYSSDARELLEAAFENSEQSSVRDEYVEQPSRAFSRWHRTLPKWYTVIDIDWAYYYNSDRSVYLFCETITVPEDALGNDVDERYPVNRHKRDVLEGLSDVIGVPAAVVWHTESCDRFFVKELGVGSELRELTGDGEYADWVDEYRLEEGSS